MIEIEVIYYIDIIEDKEEYKEKWIKRKNLMGKIVKKLYFN